MTTLTLSPDMTDAALSRAMAKALRSGDALVIEGEMQAPLGAEATAWMTALAQARIPVSLMLSGEIGPRGIALALLADTITTRDAQAATGLHRHPMLAALAADRIGHVAARAFLTEPAPLTALERTGALHGGAATLFAGLKPALVAAAELPLDEALEFAAHLPVEEDAGA